MVEGPEVHTQAGVSRRVLAKGTAWTLPAVAVAAAAPRVAASPPPPGLQGWVQIGKQCRSGADTLTINGVGDYPDRGLWVFYTTAATVLTNARVTFYYPSSLVITWSAAAGNSGWSVPATGGPDPAIAGFTAYTTSYSGAWTWVNGTPDDYSLANGDPNFTGSVALTNAYCDSDGLPVYARRTVTVTTGSNSETITFLRGPVNL